MIFFAEKNKGINVNKLTKEIIEFLQLLNTK